MSDITRREAIKVITVGGVTAAFFAAGGNAILRAFGDDDGGGSGGTTGGGEEGGSGVSYRSGYAWTWYDNGGFFNGTSEASKAVQGWDEASINWFWDGKDKNGKLVPYSIQAMMADIMDSPNIKAQAGVRDAYVSAARQAIEGCKEMLRQQGSKSLHARVVGVGWTFNAPTPPNTWLNVSTDSWDRHFTKLLRKEAVADNGGNWQTPIGKSITNLAESAGWGKPTDMPGYEGMNWRDAIYKLGSDQQTASNYIWVVVAAGDGWPSQTGKLSIKKTFNGDQNREFKFRVTFTGNDAPAAKEFTLKASDPAYVIDEIPADVKYSVTELTTGYTTTWTHQSGTIVGGETINVVCYNKSGHVSFTKRFSME